MKHEIAGALTGLALLVLAFLSLPLVVPEVPLTVVSSNLWPYGAILLIGIGLALAIVAARIRSLLVTALGLALLAYVGMVIYQHWDTWRSSYQPATGGSLQLLSFNILNQNAESGEEIAAYLAASEIDVALILEAGPIEPFLSDLASHFPYRLGCGEATRTCDSLILSRLPIRDSEVATLGPLSTDRYLQTKIVVGDQVVTLVSAHLVKPYFDGYGWLEIRRLAKRVMELPGAVVVAGDFNAAPWSNTVGLFLERTGLIPMPFPVGTWPAEAGAFGVPIDHVFTRLPAVVADSQPLPNAFGSNHRGLLSTIAIAQ